MSETTTRFGIGALGVLVGLVGVLGIILVALNRSPTPPSHRNRTLRGALGPMMQLLVSQRRKECNCGSSAKT